MYELSNREKSYLKSIVINTRNEYLRKNKYVVMEDDIDFVEEKYLVSIENVEINFEIKSDNELMATNIENIFADKNITKYVKALTLKEKLVLFSYYIENKTDQTIANVMNIKRSNVKQTRLRALEKIRRNYLNERK